MSTILENYYDPKYDPTEQEIKDYGAWLGLDLPEENDLLWIARDGLKAPLPENWKACKSEKGELYYFNFKTGQSIWDHPSDDKFKEQAKIEQEKRKKLKAEGGDLTKKDGSNDSSAVNTKSSKKEGKLKLKGGLKRKEGATVSTDSTPQASPRGDSGEASVDKKGEEEDSPLSTTGTASSSSSSSKGKGSKLAALKNLKNGKGPQRQAAVTLNETPVSSASPHAKKEKELAPLLKAPGTKAPAATKEGLSVLTGAGTSSNNTSSDNPLSTSSNGFSPQPKNPNPLSSEEAQPVLTLGGGGNQQAAPQQKIPPSILKQPVLLEHSKLDLKGKDDTSSPPNSPPISNIPNQGWSSHNTSAPAAATPILQTETESPLAVAEKEKEVSKANEKALAAFKANEERRLEQEKQAARTSYDNLLRTAKEQLAKKHQESMDALKKENEQKLQQLREQLGQKNKSEVEALNRSMKAKKEEEKEVLEDKNDQEIAAMRKKLQASLNQEIDAMEADHQTLLAAEKKKMEEKNQQEIIKIQMSSEQKEEWNGVGDTLNEVVGDFFQSMELALTQFTTATTSLSLEELRKQAADRVTAVEKEAEEELEREKTSGIEAVEKYREEFNKKFAAEREMSDERINHLAASNKAETQRIVEQHEKALQELKASHRDAKAALEKANDEEIGFLRSAHSQRLEDLELEMRSAFNERKAVLASHYEKEEEKELSRVDLGIPPAVDTTKDDSPMATESSTDEAAAEILRAFPTSAASTSAAAPAPSVSVSPESTQTMKTKEDSEKLRSAVFEVLQDVLQAHPLLRQLQEQQALGHEQPAPADDRAAASTPPAAASAHAALTTTPLRHLSASASKYPSSFAEQQALLDQETIRVEEAKKFVLMQRATLADRKTKLKGARRQWKKDVLEAKAQGTTAGSKQAALLRKIQRVLDTQAEGLAQDEAILKDSEHWLQVKEGRVQQLASELELRGDCDLSALSVDTNQLMGGGAGNLLITPRKQQHPTPIAATNKRLIASSTHTAQQPATARTTRSSSASKRRAEASPDALYRIERRLDAMASAIANSSNNTKPEGILVKKERSASLAATPLPASSAAAPLGILANATNNHHHHRSSRKRSSSATRKQVGFMASAYPIAGASNAWLSGSN